MKKEIDLDRIAGGSLAVKKRSGGKSTVPVAHVVAPICTIAPVEWPE